MNKKTFNVIREVLFEIFEKDQKLSENRKLILQLEDTVKTLKENSIDLFKNQYDVQELNKELESALKQVEYWKDHALTAIHMLKQEMPNLSEETKNWINNSVFPSE